MCIHLLTLPVLIFLLDFHELVTHIELIILGPFRFSLIKPYLLHLVHHKYLLRINKMRLTDLLLILLSRLVIMHCEVIQHHLHDLGLLILLLLPLFNFELFILLQILLNLPDLFPLHLLRQLPLLVFLLLLIMKLHHILSPLLHLFILDIPINLLAFTHFKLVQQLPQFPIVSLGH